MKQASKERLTLPAMSRGMQALAVVAFFILGVGATYLVLRNPMGVPVLSGGEKPPAEPISQAPQQQVVYQCPMHPEVVESDPANCPICGMQLQEVRSVQGGGTDREHPDPTAGTGPGNTAVIAIDPVQIQNIGLVSVVATRGDVSRSVRAVGIIDFDAERITWVNIKFSGWIEKVHVNYVGQQLHAGDPLFDIYSPDLVTTQEEYLRALDYFDSLQDSPRHEARKQAEALLDATRERLLYWDITAEQVQALTERRTVQRLLTVVSPGEGVVAEVADEALEGMFVRPGMNLYKVADLSTVWAHADIYERDMPWIRAGLPARVSLAYDLDRDYESQVLFLYPEVSAETRTLKICVEIPNHDRKLRPGMYADVVLEGESVKDAVLIPNSAVLHSGERKLVFIDLGDGRFEPREVVLGVVGEDDLVQVVTGVEAGEAVVTQSQFMLDSESRVREAIAKFLERGSAVPPADEADHRGHR